jgi:phosphate-selective porin
LARLFRIVKISVLLPAVVLLLAPATRAAEAVSIEDRLRALEARVDLLQQENAALRRQLVVSHAGGPGEPAATPPRTNPAPTAIVPVPAGRETRLVLGGYTQMQAEFGGTGDARFTGGGDRIYARRARISLGGSFAEHFDFRVEGEFGAGSITSDSAVRAKANEIYFGWNRYPGASVRFGQLKPAFSAELLATQSKSPFIERSLGSERLGDGRQVGGAVSGSFADQHAGYLVFVGNGSGSNSSRNDNRKFLQTAHVYAVPLASATAGELTLGASALHSTDNGITKSGPNFDATPGGAIDNLFAGTRDGWGLDAAWHLGRFDLSSELLRVRYRPVNAIPDRSFTAESWQLSAAYYLVPRQLQAALRRERFDPNSARGGDATENWLAGLSYNLKGDDLRILVDYLFGRAAGLAGDDGRLLTRFQIVY